MNNISHPGKVLDYDCSILLLVACKEYGSLIRCGRSPFLETWKWRKINRICRESVSHVNLLCESWPNSINFNKNLCIFNVYSAQDIHKFTMESLWFNFVTTFGFKFHCNHTLKPPKAKENIIIIESITFCRVGYPNCLFLEQVLMTWIFKNVYERCFGLSCL